MQVAEVQAVGGGIEADVERDRLRAGGEELLELRLVRHVGDQPAPLQFINDRFGHRERLLNEGIEVTTSLESLVRGAKRVN
jgi:hypothetical protein